MRIPEETVRQIQQTADIVDVVGDYVSLKKRGANLTACCPFHNEKTPSFNVNPARGIYKCFGCGKAGDSVKFIMDIEGIGFPEALRHLAKKYGIDIPETEQTPEDVAAQNERESLYIALNFAKKFYQEQLTQTDEGQSVGVSYFKERGFNDRTIGEFELGYSPEQWDALTKAALKAGFSLDILEKAGLILRREQDGKADAKVFDRFRARVIFPIHNLSGKVIAFGARILKADKNQPKYLNSPETEAGGVPLYHKSNVLYGIFQAKTAIRNDDVAFLVEGYTDVISLHQAGIHNVVASSGTALTLEQIRLIGRFTPNVTVLFDGDAAGVKASLRGMDLILEEGLNVKLCTFPEGHDPDSYVRAIGGEAFKAYVRDHATDFITFKAQLSLDEAGNDPFKRAGVIKDMVESIAKIPDAIKRSVFFQQTARMMGIDEGILIAEANRKFLTEKKKAAGRHSAGRADNRQSRIEPGEIPDRDSPVEGFTPDEFEIAPSPQRSVLSRHEEEFCRLLVCYGPRELEPGYTLMQYLLDELGTLDFQTPTHQKILTYARQSFARGEVPDAQEFLGHPDEDIRQESIGLVTERYSLSDNWVQMHQIHTPNEIELLDRMAHGNLLRLKKAVNEQRLEAVKQALSQTADAGEQEALLTEFMKIKRIDKALASELGIVVAG
ncbi:MAG: DNA primase [Cytophagaceae bacterium]|nr:DNA primase [Cytophagaceae bacterium]